MSNGKYTSFSTVCCRTVRKNRHRLRRNAAIHFHLLHTHQGPSALLVVPARIGAPTSRCYDAAGRACCDAATRLNDPKASPSQAPLRIFETSPLEHPSLPRPLLLLAPETTSEQRPLPRAPRGPPERERRGRSRKSKGEKGRGEGASPFFSQRTTAKQSVARITQKR